MNAAKIDEGGREDGVGEPILSIVVPVYRQWSELATLLECWRRLDGAADVELIVVDNEPGGDGAARLPDGARMIACDAPGSYAARNAGAAVARGTWLVFTDADCRPDPSWLVAFRREMERTPDDLLAGNVVMVADPPATAWASYDLVRGIPQERYVGRGYAATANLAVPRTLFEELGGFDPRRFSGGDAEFCRRARARGRGIRFVADAVVRHPARRSWAELRTKARRVKGAQLTQGSPRLRLYWLMRTCLPPVHEIGLLLRTVTHRWRDRFVACGVRLCLWAVELREGVRIFARRSDLERR